MLHMTPSVAPRLWMHTLAIMSVQAGCLSGKPVQLGISVERCLCTGFCLNICHATCVTQHTCTFCGACILCLTHCMAHVHYVNYCTSIHLSLRLHPGCTGVPLTAQQSRQIYVQPQLGPDPYLQAYAWCFARPVHHQPVNAGTCQ